MSSIASPRLELAKRYLQSDYTKDDFLSDELREGLWELAGEAAIKGDLETCELATDRIPLDVAFFLNMKEYFSKEELTEVVKGFNMSAVIGLFGENYLEN